jgi:hypothetical protein
VISWSDGLFANRGAETVSASEYEGGSSYSSISNSDPQPRFFDLQTCKQCFAANDKYHFLAA